MVSSMHHLMPRVAYMALIPYGPTKTCSTSNYSTIVLYIMITGIASLFCNADGSHRAVYYGSTPRMH